MDHMNYKYFLLLSRLFFRFMLDDSFLCKSFYISLSPIAYFCFYLFTWGQRFKNKQTNMNYVKECFPVRVLSGLAFGSLMILRLFFLYGVRKCSDFLVTYSCSVFPACQKPLIKENVFSPFSARIFFSHRSIDCKWVCIVLGTIISSTDLFICFCATVILFWLL